MVTIKRIKREKHDDQLNTMYDLLEIYIQEPNDNPDPNFLVRARPIEFNEVEATRYVATSPHDGQGITFYKEKIITRSGYNFTSCPSSGVGERSATQPFDDPFINPIIEGKLSESGLDPDLMSANTNDDNSRKTIAEKIHKNA